MTTNSFFRTVQQSGFRAEIVEGNYLAGQTRWAVIDNGGYCQYEITLEVSRSHKPDPLGEKNFVIRSSTNIVSLKVRVLPNLTIECTRLADELLANKGTLSSLRQLLHMLADNFGWIEARVEIEQRLRGLGVYEMDIINCYDADNERNARNLALLLLRKSKA